MKERVILFLIVILALRPGWLIVSSDPVSLNDLPVILKMVKDVNLKVPPEEEEVGHQ